MKSRVIEYGSYVGVVAAIIGVIALFAVTNSPDSASFETKSSQADSVPLTSSSQETKALNGTQTKAQGGTVLKGTKLDNFDPIAEPASELQAIDIVEGTGTEVTANSTITAHYTGAYAVNGEIFESSKDSGQTFTSPLSGLITGWIQGLPGMKAGGVRRLIIPGELAYGEAPQGYTPGSTARPMGTLVFDIEVIASVE